MQQSKLALLLLSILLITGTLVPAFTRAQTGQSGAPITVVGTLNSKSYAIDPDKLAQVSVALVDARNLITGDTTEWLPTEGQILGFMTTPVFPLPSHYQINLPAVPSGSSLDLDNDGTTDTGVQVFYLIVAANVINDSYLQQLEQIGGLTSFLSDPLTGALTEGDLLVYAPDDAQAFPSGAGTDGAWFTADDEVLPLEPGYTQINLASDGTSLWFRTPELTIDTREAPEVASPDFSAQGILESYDSLIDHLKVRYAYTELRGLDWEVIRAQYLPEVEAADAANDLGAYAGVLRTLALSIHDAHVTAIAGPEVEIGLNPDEQDFVANVGAWLIQIQHPASPDDGVDGAFVVLSVGKDTPAAQAGWVPGTEIISVDGETPAAKLERIPLVQPVGTEAGFRKQLTPGILAFPDGHAATIEYRLPGSDEIQTATLVSGMYSDLGLTNISALVTLPIPFPIAIRQEGAYTVLEWRDFSGSVATKIAVLEEALALHQGMDTGGMILDLRSNGGGWAELYEIMASYFYTTDDPLPAAFFDFWRYDNETGAFVRPERVDYTLSAPKPELAYTGPLVILVDEKCASACEYFSQTLQKTGRAIVVGQYPTEGAGGFIDIVTMPGGIRFVYTAGQTTYAGTTDFNLEAKGVIPDVWVPVTVETELAKQNGGDPVMDAAIAVLDRVNAESMATPVATPYDGPPEATPAP